MPSLFRLAIFPLTCSSLVLSPEAEGDRGMSLYFIRVFVGGSKWVEDPYLEISAGILV